jgi:hypothetical protein
MPVHEQQQDKNAIQTTLDELVALIKQTHNHKEVGKVLKAMPGLQAALEHQRDGLLKLKSFPEAFPEYSPRNSPTSSPKFGPIKSPGKDTPPRLVCLVLSLCS